MKKLILVLCTICCLYSLADDNGLQVVSFKQDLMDLAARTSPQYDNDGDYCALVKIQVLAEDHISFQGSYIKGDVLKNANEYWVYMGKGAKKINVSHPRYETLQVIFGEVNEDIRVLEAGSTYKLVISVPEKDVDTIIVAETFDAKVAEARKMYKQYSSHSESEYFRKAAGLYDAAMKHTDCPTSMLQTLQVEYDDMRFMRKFTFLYEKANRIASEMEQTYGYNSDSVYYYLQLAYKSALKLTQKYPAAKSFKQLSQAASDKLSKHPKGQQEKQMVVSKKNASAHGIVTLKKSNQPLNTIAIYACQKSKPSAKDARKMIGMVQPNGHYNVILPQGYDYIIFDGEKNAHSVPSENTEINITL